jgi:hypothetical protein
MEVATPLTPNDTPSQTWGPIATILKQNEQLSEVEHIVSDEIDSDKKDTLGPFRAPETTTEQISDAEFLSCTSSKYTSHMKYISPASTMDDIISWKYDGARLGPNGSQRM